MIDVSTKDATKLRTAVRAEAEKLQAAAAVSTSRCTVATYIALSTEKVQEKLIEKIMDGYVPKGTACIQPDLSIPEYAYVLFQFECPSGTYCIINPSFLVVVDVTNGKVVGDPVDPYLPYYGPSGVLWPMTDGFFPWSKEHKSQK